MRTIISLSRPALLLIIGAVWMQTASAGAAADEAVSPKIQDLFGQAGNLPGDRAAEPQVTVALSPETAGPGDDVTLAIKVVLPPGSYTYPTNPSFGTPTKIEITRGAGLTPLGEGFEADRAPKVVDDPILKKKVEKYFGTVTWSRKYRIEPDARAQDLSIAGTFRYQVCDTSCRILNERFEATLPQASQPISTTDDTPLTRNAAESPREIAAHPAAASRTLAAADRGATSAGPSGKGSSTSPFVFETTPTRKIGSKEKPDPLKLRFELSPRNAKPGDEVTASITAAFEGDWYAYALTHDTKPVGLPTRIAVKEVNSLEPVGKGWIPDHAPKVKHSETDGQLLKTHPEKVTWSRKFKVASSAAGAGGYGLSGSVRYQICDKACLPPKTVAFSLGDLTTPTPAPEASNTIGPEPSDEKETASAPLLSSDLGWYLFAAFLGGLILNVMPCVLPVIAIKVLSFVHQAGENRGRILGLNLSYSAGVITVFLFLATLASALQIGWGGLFQKTEFVLIMAGLVFAMGLSLLGVFEIPVPGMVGSAAGHQHQEGLGGAFLTGIFATLLATPCSGPFLGATLAWSVQQPTVVTYLIWTTMGLGMASPYVVFGLFPGAVKFLPKPGNWMVRFKEFCGFVLLGTVVFILSFLDKKYTITALIMLLGIGLGTWMVGKLYHVNSPARRKWSVRFSAVALTGVIFYVGWGFGGGPKLPWQPFTEKALAESLEQNKPVLVDFTADWCLTCKTNEKLALNTEETLALVEKYGIVPLYADYTHESPEIKQRLAKHDSISVPLTVIYPADPSKEPIVLRDLYTKSQLLKKLEEATAGAKTASSDGDTPPADAEPERSQAAL